MRLLVDLHSFDNNNREGLTTYLEGVYRELIPLCDSVEFYLAAANTANIKQVFGERENIHYLTLRSQNSLYRLMIEYPSLIKRHGIDYAHFQYISPIVKRCRCIVTLHDILFLDFPQYFPLKYRLLKGLLFRLSAQRADILLTVSRYSREQISKHYHIPRSQIHIVSNAVNDNFSQVNRAKAAEFISSRGVGKYLLYVARFEPRKNHVALLRSYCELRLWERGYELVLIGQRSLRVEAFDNYMDSLSDEVKRHIHLLSGISQQELQYWYRCASLFVYPSLCEGFGIPPLEAAVAGVPTICSGATAMSEFSFFGEDLIDAEDSQSLNQAITRNLDSRTTPLPTIIPIIQKRYNWLSSALKFKGIVEGGELSLPH